MNHRIVTVSIVALLLASMLSILSPPAAAQGGGFDSNVVSLVPFNGPQGSTSFLDVTGKTWTVNSGGGGSGVCFGPSPWPPWMDTSTFRFGGASGYFHCTESYIYTEATSDWNFGTGPFTFDWWMDVPVLPPRSDFVFAYQQFPSIGNSVQVGVLNVDSTVSLALLIYEGGNPTVHFVVPAPGITAGQWSHYALVRSGDVWFWFLDGIQQGNTTSSASWPDFASPIFFGWVDNGDLTAYFDEARVSNVARWTADFTPPTEEYTGSPVSITVTSNPEGTGFVTVDGTPITTPQNFTWQSAETHTFTAISPVPINETSYYAFTSWSDGGAQSHEIIVTESPTTYTAEYHIENVPPPVTYQLSANVLDVYTSPVSGFPVYLNGTEFFTNSTGYVAWLVEPGTYNVTVSSLYQTNATNLYRFDRWQGYGPDNPTLIVTITNEDLLFTASCYNYYRVEVSVSPSGSGTVDTSPNSWPYYLNYSGQDFYLDGQGISIYATPNDDNTFLNWVLDGNDIGSANPTTVDINGRAHTLVANFLVPTHVSVTVTSNPEGSDFVQVDGNPIVTPQVFSWIEGETHILNANSPVPFNSTHQYVWTSWSDDPLAGTWREIVVSNSTTSYTANYELAALYTPTMMLTPNHGSVGTEVTVSGSNFNTGDTSVSITGIPVSNPPVMCGVVGGTIQQPCTFTVDPLSPPGLHLVTAIGDLGDSAASIFFVTPPSSPTLLLTPDSGPAGTVVIVSGSDWGDDTEATLSSSEPGLWDGSPIPCPITAGELFCSFTVKSTAPGGTFRVTATGSPSGETAFYDFTVIATLRLTPNSGVNGTSVAMSGSGYGIGWPGPPPVDCAPFVSSDPPVFQGGLASCVINENGTLTGSFTVEGSLGDHSVIISNPMIVPQGEVNATFTVLEHSYSLTVQTDKETYQPGDPVAINGTLLDNDVPVQGAVLNVTVTDPEGVPVAGWEVPTNDQGVYEVGFTLSGSAVPGEYTAYADYLTAHAQTTFQVGQNPPAQYTMIVDTNPPGLDDPQGAGTYVSGTNVTISVSSVDGYMFEKWQRNGTDYSTQMSFQYTVDGNYTFTAIFQAISVVQITVTSSPTTGNGFVTVDETPITTPHTFEWAPGSEHNVSAASPVSVPTVRYIWMSWSDDGAQTHQITVPGANTTYTAYYQTQYILTIVTGGSGTTNPPEGVHWENASEVVQVTATPSHNWLFTGWTLDGDPAGSANPIEVTMNSEHSLVANFQAEEVCPDGYDTQLFTNPVTISAPTVWNCVNYTFTTPVSIEETGNLTVTNSLLSRTYTIPPAEIDVTGQLHLTNTQVSLSVFVNHSGGTAFTSVDSALNEGLFIVFVDDTLTINDFSKDLFVSGWTVADWGETDRTITLTGTDVSQLEIDLFASHTTMSNSVIDTVVGAGTANVAVTTSTIDELAVQSFAVFTVTSSTIWRLNITPQTSPITISNFNAELLAGSYNFQTQWGMTNPHIEVSDTTVTEVCLIFFTEATISHSTIGGIEAGVNADLTVDNSQVFWLDLWGGSVALVNTQAQYVWLESGTLTTDPSVIDFLFVRSGSATLTDTAIGEVDFAPLIPETLTVADFDPKVNGGNYNFDTWGFTSLHVTTSSCTMNDTDVDLVFGGSLTANNAVFLHVTLGSSGSGAITNSTVTSVVAYNGAVVTLLNSTGPSGGPLFDAALSGGTVTREWYTRINVYDASTGLPISGVLLTIRDVNEVSQSWTVDGTRCVTLKEYDRLSDISHEWVVAYYPYELTASKSGYQPASETVDHFSNPTVNLYLTPSTPCAGGVCVVTFHTSPSTVGSITVTGRGTFADGQTASLSVGTYTITANPPTGYAFTYWSASGVYVPSPFAWTGALQVYSDGEVTAHFIQVSCNPCDVTFHSIPATIGSVIVSGYGTYTNGQTASLPPGTYTITAHPPITVPPTPTWAFLSWATTGGVAVVGGSTATLIVTGAADGTVTVTFQQVSNQHVITVNTSPSGLDSPTGAGTYTTGDAALIGVSDISGYTFQGWLRDGAAYSTQHSFIYVVDSDHTFTALFQGNVPPSNQYTITVNTNPTGLDSPQGAGTYSLGTIVTISVSNVANYTFQKWLRDGADYSTQQSFSYTIDASHVFTAVFERNVTPPSEDLTIALGSAHLVLSPGSTAQFTVAVSSKEPVRVTLTISNIPSGWQYAFTPSVGEANPQFVSTLTVTTSTTATATSYTLTVTATGDNGKTAHDSVIVDVATTTTTPVTPIPNPSQKICVIATAAYGSPMSPEVVYMRRVRDDMIGSTPTGRVLRDWWNAFYYLWSPPIAQAISESPSLQAAFRVLLIPLVGTIHITGWMFTALGGRDLAAVTAFTIAALLSISTYIVVPLYAVRVTWAYGKHRRKQAGLFGRKQD